MECFHFPKDLILINRLRLLVNQFKNSHIKKTYPSWNQSIYIGTNVMNLTFIHPIELTDVNASIYQYNDGEYLLRQRYTCAQPNCVLSEDRYSIYMIIKETTLNIPEVTYYVEIDDNFSEYRTINQFLPGIKKGNWPIHTLLSGL